jgi:hypothetical protein
VGAVWIVIVVVVVIDAVQSQDPVPASGNAAAGEV